MIIDGKNAKRWSRLGPRAVYGMAINDLVENNDRVYTLSADLGGSSGLGRMMAAYPDRFLNTGIAEQNLIGVAAGLAKEGLIPFASSFAPFITHRCADQVRMNMGYMHLNIKTVALGSGVSMSVLGNSHYGLDDISLMRAIPGMTILSPCDCVEIVKCVEAAAEYEGPVYIRLTGEPGMPVVYEEDFDFKIGRAVKLSSGDDIVIAATGSMVAKALASAQILREEGIEASVYDVHTVKPLDENLFSDISDSCRLYVTVEEHNVSCGFGAAIAQRLAGMDNSPKVLNIGLPDEYLVAGGYDYMLNKYELTAEGIAEKIKAAL